MSFSVNSFLSNPYLTAASVNEPFGVAGLTSTSSLSSSDIPSNVPLIINGVGTSNNTINLNTDEIPQGSNNLYNKINTVCSQAPTSGNVSLASTNLSDASSLVKSVCSQDPVSGNVSLATTNLSDSTSIVKSVCSQDPTSGNVALASTNLSDASSLVKSVCSQNPTNGNVALASSNLSDGNTLVKSINTTIIPTNGNVNIGLANMDDMSISNAAANQGLIYNGTTSKWTNQEIDHTNLSNIGTNTHVQIDTFIASKDQASGIAGLDTNTKLKVSEFPNFNDVVEYWVDCNYTLGSSDGSFLKPYTTIQSALNAVGTGTLNSVSGTRGTYGEPTSSNDPFLSVVCRVFIKGGSYPESITIPAYRSIVLTAIGSVFLTNITINIFRNSSNSGVLTYGNFIVINKISNDTSISNTEDDYMGNWNVSGNVLIYSPTSGNQYTTIDLLFDGIKASSIFNTVNNTGTNGSYAINCRFINCFSSSGIDIQGSYLYSNVLNIYEIVNTNITGNIYCSSIGTISNSQLNSGALVIYASGITTQPFNFCMLNTYYNGFSLTYEGINGVLNVDNQSYIKSGRTLPGNNLSSNLTIVVDYGFNAPSQITTPSGGQVIAYDSTTNRWENAGLSLTNGTITATFSLSSTPTNGQVMVVGDVNNSTGTATLTNEYMSVEGLSDVNITAPTDDQFFYYNGTASAWEAKKILESDVAGLETDLSSKIAKINTTLTPDTNGNVNLGIANMDDVSISSASTNQGLIYNGTTSKWTNQQINHTTLSNIGTNTHAQIDSFIASKAQLSGLAPLDSSGYLPLSYLGNCTNNSIIFYVDGKYTGSVNDGSILKPFTTISSALSLISPWSNGFAGTGSADAHISDRYIIHVAGGAYDESLTIPNFAHITLVADGLVYLGYTQDQYFEGMSVAGHVRDITLNVGKPSTFTGTNMMRATCVFTTTSYMQRGQAYTHTGLQGGWKVSGIFNICVLANATSSDVEIELIDFRSCDFSDTGVSGIRASTGYFINNTSTYSSSWSSNFDVRLTGCRGNGINFAYGGNFNNFNLFELNNCYMIGTLNIGRMGSMNHTTFYATGGITTQNWNGITSTYQPYYSQMLDCTCQSGSTFTSGTTYSLYVDNATIIKSGGAITLGSNGNLTLNIDYGFPSKTVITTPSTNQALVYNGTTWVNSGLTLNTSLTDCSISSVDRKSVV